jgi:hypothetical protein
MELTQLVIDLDGIIWKNFISSNNPYLFNDNFLVKRRALIGIIKNINPKEKLF